VNGPFGDPALFVEFIFERRAFLFDIGDLAALSPRNLLRVSHVFVSHTHMDHFAGFDRLLRVNLGQEKRLCLFGPEGFGDRVEHRLLSYTWNLVRHYTGNLVIEVFDADDKGAARGARYQSRNAFAREPIDAASQRRSLLFEDDTVQVRATVLDHQMPCLAFALEEKAHVNVSAARLAELGLPTGSWLRDLKKAVMARAPDELQIRISWREGVSIHERTMPLGDLRSTVASVAPGQKIAYVVDTAFTERNAERIENLARGADTLFIEAVFLDADKHLATRKFHLTAAQAGLLGRRARAKRITPFHFSPRYLGREDELCREALSAFAG
jgi:ribonuclease Z